MYVESLSSQDPISSSFQFSQSTSRASGKAAKNGARSIRNAVTDWVTDPTGQPSALAQEQTGYRRLYAGGPVGHSGIQWLSRRRLSSTSLL